MKTQVINKVIIAGGGTGGHVYPAIAIANALKQINPTISILFVGALGRLEMEKVPEAGYPIIGLPVAGFQRRLTYKNIIFFFKLLNSIIKSFKIINSFKPDAVVGVGGYASGPIAYIASLKNIPILIQEQNSYAGLTNKMLSKRATKICVAYEAMEKFFPAKKIVFTGNPIRQDLINVSDKNKEAFQYFEVSGNRKVLLVLGGTLGARTINLSIIEGLKKIVSNNIQLIWQTGKYYYDDAVKAASEFDNKQIKIFPFISRMDLAYSAANVVVARAGAITISELEIVRKPSILVPSPNVAEDHQTKNAMALVNKNAALMIKDSEARSCLVDTAIDLLNDNIKADMLSNNMAKLARWNSAEMIANEILKLK